MPLIADYARRFGIYDNLPLYLSNSLGSGETTLMRMTTAYAMLCNGGKRIKATLIDRIQDRWGHTIYRHDERICQNCNSTAWNNQDEPAIIDKREQVIDPMTAYQITSIMEGVIERGTGQAIRAVGKHLAGKTGTTNDAKDLWFVGYSPDLTGRRLHGLRPSTLAWRFPPRPRSIPRRFSATLWKSRSRISRMCRSACRRHQLISVDLKTGMRSTGQERSLKRSSRAPRRRPISTMARSRRPCSLSIPMRIIIWGRAPAASINNSPLRRHLHPQTATPMFRRLLDRSFFLSLRAEAESLTQSIKQSMGLLRRHL